MTIEQYAKDSETYGVLSEFYNGRTPSEIDREHGYKEYTARLMIAEYWKADQEEHSMQLKKARKRDVA